jgi:hypothetical protein
MNFLPALDEIIQDFCRGYFEVLPFLAEGFEAVATMSMWSWKEFGMVA